MKNKKKKKPEKENLLLYFLAGTAVAIAILIVFSLFEEDPVSRDKRIAEEERKRIAGTWSAETESLFVKTCFEKYKTLVKDNVEKQQSTKAFCRCMLSKIKSTYEEKDLNNFTQEELARWDAECRKILVPAN